jgi:hypothetical protein
MVGIVNTTLYCPSSLRESWPAPLAQRWQSDYPQLFDDHDLRLAVRQPKNHFYEWFTAIHLFHRDGALSVVEKYDFKPHARKRDIAARVLGAQRLDALRSACAECHVQMPDLLVYVTQPSRFGLPRLRVILTVSRRLRFGVTSSSLIACKFPSSL